MELMPICAIDFQASASDESMLESGPAPFLVSTVADLKAGLTISIPVPDCLAEFLEPVLGQVEDPEEVRKQDLRERVQQDMQKPKGNRSTRRATPSPRVPKAPVNRGRGHSTMRLR